MVEKEMFKITAVCKDDILVAFEGNDLLPKVKKRVKTMTEEDMNLLACRMKDDYLTQLYWDSLRIIFEAWFLKVKENDEKKK